MKFRNRENLSLSDRNQNNGCLWGVGYSLKKGHQGTFWGDGNVLTLICMMVTLDGTLKIYSFGGFPGGAVVENLPANAGDTGSSPGLGISHMPRSN